MQEVQLRAAAEQNVDPKEEQPAVTGGTGKQKEPTNILQYADDTVFVGNATWDNVLVMKALLRGYEMVSGLTTN